MPHLFRIKVCFYVVFAICASTVISATTGFSQDLIRTIALEDAYQPNVREGFGFFFPYLNNNGSVLFTRHFTTVEFVEQEIANLETGEISTVIVPMSELISRNLILDRAGNAPFEVTQSQGFSFAQVALNAADDAVFSQSGNNINGLFRTTSNGVQQVVVDETSTVPSADPGTEFRFPLLGVSLSNDGQIAVLSDVRGPNVQQNTNSTGIYRETAPRSLDLVARENISTTSESGETVIGTLSNPAFSDSGQIVLAARLRQENNSGRSALLSRTEGGPLEVLYGEGDAVLVDGETATFGGTSGPHVVNDQGTVAFKSGSTIFVANEVGLESIATEGDLAFGTTGGIRYRSVGLRAIGNDGDVAFTASFNTAESPFVSEGSGLYLYRADQSLELIARTRNEEAVGTDGRLFTVIFSPQINDNGQIAFAANLSNTGTGIFGLDASGELQMVAASGVTIDVSDTPSEPDFRTIRNVGFTDGNSTATNGFNDLGQVAFSATFTDGTTGVFVSDRLVPPPTILGDCNLDGEVTFADIPSLIEVLISGTFLEQADCNLDDEVNFLDIAPFVEILAGS